MNTRLIDERLVLGRCMSEHRKLLHFNEVVIDELPMLVHDRCTLVILALEIDTDGRKPINPAHVVMTVRLHRSDRMARQVVLRNERKRVIQSMLN